MVGLTLAAIDHRILAFQGYGIPLVFGLLARKRVLATWTGRIRTQT